MSGPFKTPRRLDSALSDPNASEPAIASGSGSKAIKKQRGQATAADQPETPAKPVISEKVWSTDEEAYYIDLLGDFLLRTSKNKDGRPKSDTMLKGKEKYEQFAKAINDRFHKEDPSGARTYEQCRAKESNMKARCKQYIKKIFEKTRIAKTVHRLSLIICCTFRD